MDQTRSLFVGISTKNGLKWNEAKGRVSDGTLFVQVSYKKMLKDFLKYI